MNDDLIYRASGRLKCSPCKISIIANAVRGLIVREAFNQLSFCRKKISVDLLKILLSAVSNADNKSGDSNGMNLILSDIMIGPSLKLKRIYMRARGRANFKYKKYSNVIIILSK